MQTIDELHLAKIVAPSVVLVRLIANGPRHLSHSKVPWESSRANGGKHYEHQEYQERCLEQCPDVARDSA